MISPPQSNEKTAKRSSIGRGSRAPQKKFKIDEEHSKSSEDEQDFLEEYKKIRVRYLKYNPSIAIHNILSKSANNVALRNSDQMKEIMKHMISTAQDLALNEMETSLFSIYLQKINWKNDSDTCFLDLIYAAYASKKFLNEDLVLFKVYLKKKLKNFSNNYKKWFCIHEQNLNTTTIEINSRCNEYSKPFLRIDDLEEIDYNERVNDIVEIRESQPFRDAETTKSEEIIQTTTLTETSAIQATEEIGETMPLTNPIQSFDTQSQNLHEEDNNMKSPETIDNFAHQPLMLKLQPSHRSDFDISTEGTPMNSRSYSDICDEIDSFFAIDDSTH